MKQNETAGNDEMKNVNAAERAATTKESLSKKPTTEEDDYLPDLIAIDDVSDLIAIDDVPEIIVIDDGYCSVYLDYQTQDHCIVPYYACRKPPMLL